KVDAPGRFASQKDGLAGQVGGFRASALFGERPSVRAEGVRGDNFGAGRDLIFVNREHDFGRGPERAGAPERKAASNSPPRQLGAHRGSKTKRRAVSKPVSQSGECHHVFTILWPWL